ncbi:MAG: UMP kinase [Candidatus Kerfeldbacteria bacterium]|nr:UMP kinase [Candidatus Kerfeldbacteria bacterium]
MLPRLKYSRVLLKLSGEAFGSSGRTIEPKKLRAIVRELKTLRRLGVEIGVVVGGGNIWRKREQGQGLEGVTADYLGLLATVMNGLALRQALLRFGVPAVVQSAIAFDLPLVEGLNGTRARRELAQGKVVILAGGTGQVGFTTDTAAAIGAGLIKAEVLIKTGPVDGVYTADPRKVKTAKKFSSLTIREALRCKLGVMDKQAFILCQRKKIPIIVCRWRPGSLVRAVKGQSVGTLVSA